MQTTIEMSTLAAINPQTTSTTLENSSKTDPQPSFPGSVFRSHEEELGKPSVIHSYCQRAIDQGHKECIWLGMQRGRRWVAKDIQLGVTEKPLGIYELRKLSGWWKRHSLYSAVGVKEIKIRFLGFNETTNEVEIVPMDFDHATEAGNLDRDLARARSKDLEPGCGVDVMGRSHEPNIRCLNEDFNPDPHIDAYCKMQAIRDLELQKEEYKRLPSMLDYFWQNGIGGKGVEFLKATGFIHSYGFLQYETYENAANPYGKVINGFEIVEGWHVRYALCLFAAGVLLSICAVAIFTGMNHSFESGLTAGSYALALAGVFLAILTFLSAVL